MSFDLDLIVSVGRADVIAQQVFQRSIDYWLMPDHSRLVWKTPPTPPDDIQIVKGEAVEVEGANKQNIIAVEGGTIHLHGSLNSDVRIGGLTELIISGDVGLESQITTAGIAHVYVGGDFCGRVTSDGSLKLWVAGSFTGELFTGTPATQLWVEKDFSGSIRPHKRAALLMLSVDGFAHETAIKQIVDSRYTVFQGSIGSSTVPKGLYPDRETLESIAQEAKNSFNRWCVWS